MRLYNFRVTYIKKIPKLRRSYVLNYRQYQLDYSGNVHFINTPGD